MSTEYGPGVDIPSTWGPAWTSLDQFKPAWTSRIGIRFGFQQTGCFRLPSFFTTCGICSARLCCLSLVDFCHSAVGWVVVHRGIVSAVIDIRTFVLGTGRKAQVKAHVGCSLGTRNDSGQSSCSIVCMYPILSHCGRNGMSLLCSIWFILCTEYTPPYFVQQVPCKNREQGLPCQK